MKTWTMPEVAELDVTLTADGINGANDEKHQYEINHNGNNPGVVKDSNPSYPESPRTES